jgi:hypothetical protein
MGRLDYDIYKNNYTHDKINKQIFNYSKLLMDIDLSKIVLNGQLISIKKEIVDKIRKLRDTYCNYNSSNNSCEKKEVGGELTIDVNNNISNIKKMFYGQGDTIQLHQSLEHSILFHTHPNAYGIWNKASPPSEFDLQHTLELAIQGKNIINLIWDRYGVYIYYLYPEIANQLIDKVKIISYRNKLVEIFRYLKMGFGFYFNNRDYPGHYNIREPSSFSKYRNILKRLGIYVDFKPYNKKVEFLIPK